MIGSVRSVIFRPIISLYFQGLKHTIAFIYNVCILCKMDSLYILYCLSFTVYFISYFNWDVSSITSPCYILYNISPVINSIKV